jgi:hypothetical protein
MLWTASVIICLYQRILYFVTMIKLSKDNLFFWSRIFPSMACVIHAFMIVCFVMMNFWPLYLIYSVFFIIHFLIAKLWKYFFLKDAFIEMASGKICFKDLDGNGIDLYAAEIVDVRECFGLTTLTLKDNTTKIYCILASKDNLTLFFKGQ